VLLFGELIFCHGWSSAARPIICFPVIQCFPCCPPAPEQRVPPRVELFSVESPLNQVDPLSRRSSLCQAYFLIKARPSGSPVVVDRLSTCFPRFLPPPFVLPFRNGRPPQKAALSGTTPRRTQKEPLGSFPFSIPSGFSGSLVAVFCWEVFRRGSVCFWKGGTSYDDLPGNRRLIFRDNLRLSPVAPLARACFPTAGGLCLLSPCPPVGCLPKYLSASAARLRFPRFR